jgi:hypothetical protein
MQDRVLKQNKVKAKGETDFERPCIKDSDHGYFHPATTYDLPWWQL